MSDAFRTPEMAAKYKALRESGHLERTCPLCDAPGIVTFTYWKIIPNTYPYDRVAKRHDMVVPLRHTSEGELSAEEWAEYGTIKQSHLQEYDYILEATVKKKSIPAHFHLHLVDAKSA